MKKKPINEINIAGFITKFLGNIQTGTQERFIKQAQRKGVPDKIVTRMSEIDKDIRELEKILKEF